MVADRAEEAEAGLATDDDDVDDDDDEDDEDEDDGNDDGDSGRLLSTGTKRVDKSEGMDDSGKRKELEAVDVCGLTSLELFLCLLCLFRHCLCC